MPATTRSYCHRRVHACEGCRGGEQRELLSQERAALLVSTQLLERVGLLMHIYMYYSKSNGVATSQWFGSGTTSREPERHDRRSPQSLHLSWCHLSFRTSCPAAASLSLAPAIALSRRSFVYSRPTGSQSEVEPIACETTTITASLLTSAAAA